MTIEGRDMRSRLPSTWRTESLANIVTLMCNGTTAPQNQDGIGLPVTRIETISKGHIDYTRVRHLKLRPQDVEAYRLRAGDVLLSHLNSIKHIGKLARYEGTRPLIHGMNLMRVVFDKQRMDPLFGFYSLSSSRGKRYFESRAKKAINQASLNRKDIGAFPIHLPPLPEQRKIAAILSSVDDAIEKTQAVIEQVQVVKRGLMQELLTRGLPGRHTQFKQTELGEIPVCWQLALLDDVLEGIDAGWSPKCEGRPAELGEWGVLKVSSISTGLFNQYENKALDRDLNARPQFEVRRGDVLLARASGVLDLVGRSAFVHWTRPKLMLSDKTLRLRAKKSVIRSMFLNLLLEHPRVHQQVLIRATGSHMRNISQRALRRVPIPVPSLKEQEHIEMLNVHTSTRLEQETNFLRQLEVAKSALMSVLLTGELRVTLDAEAS